MAVTLMPYKIKSCGRSHKGLVRQNNEDVWEELSHAHFYALADGMGGHQAGEVAAREAVHTLCKIIEDKMHHASGHQSLSTVRRELQHAIELANFHVYKMGRNNPDLKGMGTTICCLYFHDQSVVYGHVGDSRIYRFRDGELEQMTRDDSLLRELIDQGHLSEEQASEFLYKNIITKAIGAEPSIEPGVHYDEAREGDIYMMCSDGLTDMLSDEEISKVMEKMHSVDEGVDRLISEAIGRGGHDNITIVMLMVLRDDER